MESDNNGPTKKKWSRRDLASRLLRPHLFFIRDARVAPPLSEVDDFAAAEGRSRGEGRPAIDVICCGMYRACSTWQYEVVAHLVERYAEGTRLGYVTAAEYRDIKREAAQCGQEQQRRGPRVLKSHEGDRVFARSLAAGRALGVYAYRDVRDVVYSLAHKRKLTFEQLLRQGMIHQVLANDRFWTRCPSVLVQRYDDLLRSPAEGVLALARHIGVTLDAAEAEQIALEYSQEANRARTAALRHRLHQAGVDLDSAQNAQICDASTLLHWNHMREANSSWRAEATVEHQAIVNWLCGRWLIDHGYEPKARGRWWSSRHRATPRVSMRGRVDLAVGWSNFMVRNLSLRFPAAARWLKRLLGMAVDKPEGAAAWDDKTSGSLTRPQTAGLIESRSAPAGAVSPGAVSRRGRED